MRAGGWAALRRSTILAVGRVAGAGTSRNGGPVAVAAAIPLECTGDAAATIPVTMPSAGCPPLARNAAIARRMTEAVNSAYSSAVCTKTPRRPELPPDTRHT